jgi:RNA polymerase-binding transcription factor DksA
MNKFRKQLEKQKMILSKRLEKDPKEMLFQGRRSRMQRGRNRNLRQKLLIARADQQMDDVIDAIDRLDQGIYGQCVVCGEKIEPNRLEALPTITHCWKCRQEKN